MSTTTIRGFKFDNCRLCGSPVEVTPFTDGFRVRCSSKCRAICASAPTLVRAGRIWNKVN